MTAVAHRSAVKEAAAIVEACREIRDGKPHDQFVVDVIQGRAGTSANMNPDEVIANRALELLGHARGSSRRTRVLERRPSPLDAESPNSYGPRASSPPAPSPSCSVPRPTRDPVKPWCDVIRRDLD